MTETTSDTTTMDSESTDTVKAEVKTGDGAITEKTESKTEGEAATVKTDGKTEGTTNGSSHDNEKKEDKKPDITSETALEEEIVQQVHYYFGNLNLPRDKFLQEQIKLDDGWVPLDVMLKFNRLAQLTKDTGVIVEALKTQIVPLIEISEDKTKIRRSPAIPLPELNDEWRQGVAARTIYSKGFPPKGVAIGELIQFFKQFGNVDNVQKRTYFDKKNNEVIFKGSVFVTFDSKETATKYIELESVKFGDTELIKKFQSTYYEDKRKERDEKWGRKTKERKDKDKKQQDEKDEDKVSACPRGCIFHLAGFPTEDPIDRDLIREKVTDAGGEVAYITYNRGDEEAFIRLHGDDNPAVKLLENIPEKKLKINEVELVARVLEGDEETEFLRKSLEDRDRRRVNKFRGKNSFRGRKRRGDGDRGPSAKRAAKE